MSARRLSGSGRRALVSAQPGGRNACRRMGVAEAPSLEALNPDGGAGRANMPLRAKAARLRSVHIHIPDRTRVVLPARAMLPLSHGLLGRGVTRGGQRFT